MKHGINPLVYKGAEHMVVQKLRVNLPETISRWLCTSIIVEISHFLVLSACVSKVESLDNSQACCRKNLIFVSRQTFLKHNGDIWRN